MKAVFFDLDGTLLRINEKRFAECYLFLLAKKLKPYGYDPDLLVKSIMDGLKSMMLNDSGLTNEEVFWNSFEKTFPKSREKHSDIFDDFYRNDFKALKIETQENVYIDDIMNALKRKNLLPVLTTNPIFPMEGQKTRISFLGLTEKDFAYITSYENSYHCKPNPKYFVDVMQKLNLKPNEVILFGNNRQEDYDCAMSLGIKTYLVNGYLIDRENKGTEGSIELSDIPRIIESLN